MTFLAAYRDVPETVQMSRSGVKKTLLQCMWKHEMLHRGGVIPVMCKSLVG